MWESRGLLLGGIGVGWLVCGRSRCLPLKRGGCLQGPSKSRNACFKTPYRFRHTRKTKQRHPSRLWQHQICSSFLSLCIIFSIWTHVCFKVRMWLVFWNIYGNLVEQILWLLLLIRVYVIWVIAVLHCALAGLDPCIWSKYPRWSYTHAHVHYPPLLSPPPCPQPHPSFPHLSTFVSYFFCYNFLLGGTQDLTCIPFENLVEHVYIFHGLPPPRCPLYINCIVVG